MFNSAEGMKVFGAPRAAPEEDEGEEIGAEDGGRG